MSPILGKIPGSQKVSWPLRPIIRAYLAGMLIIISGCASFQPVDIPDENALEPAETELWTALAVESRKYSIR